VAYVVTTTDRSDNVSLETEYYETMLCLYERQLEIMNSIVMEMIA
jgi:hypothetical protein